MELPSWFGRAIQSRMDEVSARIEHDPELSEARTEESKAFEVLFAGIDKERMAEFDEWEDKHNLKEAVMYKLLYMQGMKDGFQLAVALGGGRAATMDKPAAVREKAAEESEG